MTATIRPRVLLIIATAFGISSTIQAYWIARLAGDTHWPMSAAARLFALNLIYWYVPALVAPIIMTIAARYRLGRVSWPALVGLHIGGVLSYALLHESIMVLSRWTFEMGRTVLDGCWSCTLEDSIQQLDWLLMTYLFFVGLAYALIYQRESEAQALNAAQLQTRLVEAQLQSLQRQLQPHFLFNTLHTISALMRTNLAAADRMMDQLGDLLRMSLRRSGADQVPLKEELEALQKYLDIEQARFGSRLEIHTRVEPEALDGLVPYLLLQPLVENAIRHGVAPHARAGWVAIHALRTGQQLQIEVLDSGDGLPPHRLGELNQGVGLSNTRARLEHLYQTGFQVVCSNLPHGFRVKVIIPFRQAPGVGAPPKGTA